MKCKSMTVNAVVVLGVLLLLGSFARADFSNVRVYPNPVRVSQGNTTATFDNLPGETTVKIFTINGQLVREETIGVGITSFQWDLTNNDDNAVASGMYIYVLIDRPGNKSKGKIAIIR